MRATTRPITVMPQLAGHLALPLVTLAVLAALLTGATQPAGSMEARVEFETFAEGFDEPVDIQSAGDDRLFVVERPGQIFVVDADGERNTEPFLDLREPVTSSSVELGLLGLAFAPDYATSGHFYVNYTRRAPLRTVVSRFTVSPNDPDRADPTSEQEVLVFDQPFNNHNGGQLVFGTDGYLYISVGDGGDAGDPLDNAQDTQTILGSIVRIDVAPNRPQPPASLAPRCSNGPADGYSIPADNPFVADSAACAEIWSYGLRNPWRFSLDADGAMWIGDVGQDDREELNRVPSGGRGVNYGWPCFEGDEVFDSTCTDVESMVAPVFAYPQRGGACSITAGQTSSSASSPRFDNVYFFADYCNGQYWSAPSDVGVGDTPAVTEVTVVGQTPPAPSTFGKDTNGNVYVASFLGTIYRIVDPDAIQPEVAISSSCLNNDGRLDITLTNTSATTTTYGLQVGRVPERMRTLSTSASTIVTYTGRPDGQLVVTVTKDGATAYQEQLEVTCDPELQVKVSCLAENGRIDAVLRNRTNAATSYSVEVGTLAPRTLLVAAESGGQVSVTGRRDGPLQVVVRRNDVIINQQTVTVACDPVPTDPVSVTTSCLGGNGRVDVILANTNQLPTVYQATVGGLIRSATVAAESTGKITVTGRPDGALTVVVTADGQTLLAEVLTISCD